MPRQSYVIRDGKAIPKHLARPTPRNAARQGKRSSLAAPAVISDIDDYESMITGERITSRSTHRDHLRDHGYQEVGDETPEFIKERRRYREEMGEEPPASMGTRSDDDDGPADSPFTYQTVDVDDLQDV